MQSGNAVSFRIHLDRRDVYIQASTLHATVQATVMLSVTDAGAVFILLDEARACLTPEVSTLLTDSVGNKISRYTTHSIFEISLIYKNM